MIRALFYLLFLLSPVFSIFSEDIKEILSEVKTDSPRATIKTFIDAMNNYKKGVEQGKPELKNKIQSAVRCLDLKHTPYLLRSEKGTEIAIFLKEIMDRVAVINYSEIPDKPDEPRWRFYGTDIIIIKIAEGERSGEWLFSEDTTINAKEFYEKVKSYPYIRGSGGGANYESPWINRILPEWSNKLYFGTALWQWIGIFIFCGLGFLTRWIISLFMKLLAYIASKTNTLWDDELINAVSSPSGYLAASALWFYSFSYLRLDGNILKFLSTILNFFFGFFLTWMAYRTSGVVNKFLDSRYQEEDSHFHKHINPLIGKTIKVVIVISGSLLTIQSIGFNVMSLLAGLGIGGLAFALAAKDTAANLFGSIMILFDKPFKSGDQVVVGNYEGFVEDIGLRSTRLRTFYDSVVSIPNSDMANARIDNLGLRKVRRVYTNLVIPFQTQHNKISEFVDGIKSIILNDPDTKKEEIFISFNNIVDHGFNILLFFYLNVSSYSEEIVIRQRLLIEIIKLAESMGIKFAYPTRTLDFNIKSALF